MFFDHIFFLFSRPKEVDEPLTFYPPPSAKVEEFSVEISSDLASKLSSLARQEESPTAQVVDYVPVEKVDEIVAERVEAEKQRFLARAEIHERNAERFHLEILRRDSLELMEKQKELLPKKIVESQEALKLEEEVLSCYRDNPGKTLKCAEKVRQLQLMAKKASLE